MRLPVLLALCGVAIAVCLVQGVAPRAQGTVMLFAAAALGLEMTAVKLPRYGFLSNSFPCLYCIALLPDAGPLSACLVLLAGLLLRSLLRPRSDWKVGVLETAAEGLPSLAALANITLLLPHSEVGRGGFPLGLKASLGALLVFLVLGHWCHRFAAAEVPGMNSQGWGRLAEVLSQQTRFSAVFAPVLLLLVATRLWQALWMAPVFLGLYRFSRARLDELQAAHGQIRKTASQLRRSERHLSGTRKERDLVAECSKRFQATQRVEQTLEAADRLLKSISPSFKTVAILLHHENRLTLSYGRGAEKERLAELAQREEVVRCWKSQRPVRGEEPSSLCFPLGAQGVFYLAQGEFSEQEEELLSILADQTALGIQSAARQENLSLWNRRLVELLDGSRDMTAARTQQDLISLLEASLKRVVPYRWGALFLDGDSHPLAEPPNFQHCLQIHEMVCEKQEALVFQEAQPGIPSLHQQQQSFLALPLRNEDGVWGSLQLATPLPRAFTPAVVQLVSLLSLHTGVVCTNLKAQRDLEESQAQLIQSGKMAAVGQLAAGVAHELNTPLGTILLNIQAAERAISKGQPEKASHKLQQSVTGTRVAKEIVAKLLNYSRKDETQRRTVDLNTVVTDTLKFLGSQLNSSRLTLEQQLSPRPVMVRANPNELQQVLINLLNNARDAVSEEGLSERKVQLGTDSREGNAILWVSDSGRGISEENAARVFEPFYTEKTVGQGTGLGLYISRQIVEQHSGQLQVGPGDLGGARFWMTLPEESSSPR